MRRNHAPFTAESAITLYFNKDNVPTQQETLGAIVS